ncbi:serine protein kinase RIO, partial [Candidatus Woesearchaeota archaeon]|nr:serine protein kinase RIO [Candidatus Woesearchaeota archaeon]
MVRDSRESYKVYGNVFDNFTTVTLQKLKDKGILSELVSPISVGKESNVFTATSDRGIVVVKIYRLHTCDFNRMYDYLKYDERYQGLRKNKRKIIFSWTQREYRNLHIAREAGVRVPTPLTFLNHVLVLEFIGDEERAPRLKDQSPSDPAEFFDECIMFIRKLYRKQMVHGDLSAFNILNLADKPVFIDFSQATTTE